MIRISSVEGALRVLRGNTLGINAGCALSKRASSGPIRLDPATLSPCEAWFGSGFRRQESGGIWIEGGAQRRGLWLFCLIRRKRRG